MGRTVRNVVLVASVALALAACGRKSDLKAPEAPADVPKDANGKPAPDRPFVLDPLLR